MFELRNILKVEPTGFIDRVNMWKERGSRNDSEFCPEPLDGRNCHSLKFRRLRDRSDGEYRKLSFVSRQRGSEAQGWGSCWTYQFGIVNKLVVFKAMRQDEITKRRRAKPELGDTRMIRGWGGKKPREEAESSLRGRRKSRQVSWNPREERISRKMLPGGHMRWGLRIRCQI